MNASSLRIAAIVAAAVAITAIATAAVTAAVTEDDTTLSQLEIDQLLAQAGSTASSPGTTGAPTVDGSAPGDSVATLIPGTVTVHCDGDNATLVSWSPNPGFRVDDVVRGPAKMVVIRFESDDYDDYKVVATCTDGTATVRLGPDDHHGGGDDGGSNRGPGGGG